MPTVPPVHAAPDRPSQPNSAADLTRRNVERVMALESSEHDKATTADRVDPFPFPLLTLVLSVEAIFLSIFILMSQNRAAKVSDKRGHLDLQLNMLTEQENTKMLRMLEDIGRVVGAEFCSGPEV